MAKKRGSETVYDMILSIGAVLIVVAILLIITWRPKHQYSENVDYENAKAQAVASALWPIYIPNELPAEFKITSARFEAESYGQRGDSRWYLGFAGSSEEYISLWESDGVFTKVQDAATNNGSCLDYVLIAGEFWEKCESKNPLTRSYVKKTNEVITVVSGTVSWEDLEKFVKSLMIIK